MKGRTKLSGDDVPTVQEQARALGDPTRHAIFRRVATADGPLTIAELTAHVGLHHTAVRQHLEANHTLFPAALRMAGE